MRKQERSLRQEREKPARSRRSRPDISEDGDNELSGQHRENLPRQPSGSSHGRHRVSCLISEFLKPSATFSLAGRQCEGDVFSDEVPVKSHPPAIGLRVWSHQATIQLPPYLHQAICVTMHRATFSHCPVPEAVREQNMPQRCTMTIGWLYANLV